MAAEKIEGIQNDIIVIYYEGEWYGIPLGALAGLECVQQRYGLVMDVEKFQMDGVSSGLCVTDEQLLAGYLVELRKRYFAMRSDPVEDLRGLIGRNVGEFAGFLVSYLMP